VLEVHATLLEETLKLYDLLFGTGGGAHAHSIDHGDIVPTVPRHSFRVHLSVPLDQLIKLTEDLVLIDSRPDRIRSRSSARPLNRLMRDGKRDFKRLHDGCHLSEVGISRVVGEESGTRGLGDPVRCAIQEGIILLRVEGARAEGVESMVSVENFPSKLDEAPEITLELDELVFERKAVEIESVDTVGAVATAAVAVAAADVTRGGVHTIAAVSGETTDGEVEAVSSASHIENDELWYRR
jgi:hypothetical protein